MLKVVHEENDTHDNSAGCGGSLLDQVVRDGARQLLTVALQAEVAAYIEAHAHERDEAGRRLVVRNGHHEPREDADKDGVPDSSEGCADTVLPNPVSSDLKPNHYKATADGQRRGRKHPRVRHQIRLGETHRHPTQVMRCSHLLKMLAHGGGAVPVAQPSREVRGSRRVPRPRTRWSPRVDLLRTPASCHDWPLPGTERHCLVGLPSQHIVPPIFPQALANDPLKTPNGARGALATHNLRSLVCPAQ